MIKNFINESKYLKFFFNNCKFFLQKKLLCNKIEFFKNKNNFSILKLIDNYFFIKILI